MTSIRFEIWGCRGGRNTHGSRIGNNTSCYSLRSGADMFVFDAGQGLVVLADAVLDAERMRGVSRVHLLVTHAHMDHWEGLKDAAWMWRPRNGLELTVVGPGEALATIRRAHDPPSFVPLDILALNTLSKLSFVELAAGATLAFPGATLRTVALNHYSGKAPARRHLETLGYHLQLDGGPGVAYLSDHEPTSETHAVEHELLDASQLAIVDANYGDIAEHAFGHGSIEYVASLACHHPQTTVLAAHHGPLRSDDAIVDDHRRHGGGWPNFRIAQEGDAARWDPTTQTFTPD